MSADQAISAAFDFGPTCPARVGYTGEWRRGVDGAEYVGTGPGTVTLDVSAAEVHLVLSSATGEPLLVAVQEDGPPLDREWCGADCAEHQELGAAMVVAERRVYHVSRRDEVERHELTLKVEVPGLRVHEARFS